MASKNKTQLPFVVTLLDGKSEETEILAEADWLLLTTDTKLPIVEIGRTRTELSAPAITWFQDHVKFGRYDHPLTDMANGIHVYKTVGDAEYAENAGVIYKDDGWHELSIIRNPLGKRELHVGRLLDPVNHIDDLVITLSNKHVDPTKIAKAVEAERTRAKYDHDRIAKHNMAAYNGFSLKVRIAFMRDRAQQAMSVLREPDLEKAWEMRNAGIEKKQAYQAMPKGVMDAVRQANSQVETDCPDGVVQAETPELAIDDLILPWVNENRAVTGEKCNLKLLPNRTQIQLYQISSRGRAIAIPPATHWNPSDQAMVESLTANSGSKNGFHIGVSFMLNEKTKLAIVK